MEGESSAFVWVSSQSTMTNLCAKYLTSHITRCELNERDLGPRAISPAVTHELELRRDRNYTRDISCTPTDSDTGR